MVHENQAFETKASEPNKKPTIKPCKDYLMVRWLDCYGSRKSGFRNKGKRTELRPTIKQSNNKTI
jgi:hypothetical protein